MLVLAESVEDWAELLRQAIRYQIFDVRYEVTPYYLNASGEIENTASGYEFSLHAHAPHSVSLLRFQIVGMGSTPEEAAQEACRRWLSDGNYAHSRSGPRSGSLP